MHPRREPLAHDRSEDDDRHPDHVGASDVVGHQAARPEDAQGDHALDEEAPGERRPERIAVHPGRLERDHERRSVRAGARRERSRNDAGGDLGPRTPREPEPAPEPCGQDQDDDADREGEGAVGRARQDERPERHAQQRRGGHREHLADTEVPAPAVAVPQGHRNADGRDQHDRHLRVIDDGDDRDRDQREAEAHRDLDPRGDRQRHGDHHEVGHHTRSKGSWSSRESSRASGNRASAVTMLASAPEFSLMRPSSIPSATRPRRRS